VHINYKQTPTTSPLLLFLSHSAYQILINTRNFTTSLVPVPQCISIINKHPQLHHFSCSCPTVHINHNKHPQLHHFSCSCPTVHINLNKHSQLHSICRSLLAVAQRTRRIWRLWRMHLLEQHRNALGQIWSSTMLVSPVSDRMQHSLRFQPKCLRMAGHFRFDAQVLDAAQQRVCTATCVHSNVYAQFCLDWCSASLKMISKLPYWIFGIDLTCCPSFKSTLALNLTRAAAKHYS